MLSVNHNSLKKNMFLNTIKGLMSLIFPLITFPYVSKVLGVNNLGRYNFASSIISYFILLSGLGINSYAIREGARIRENRDEIEEFASEIISINMVSTIVSYILFALFLVLAPRYRSYNILLMILSLQMILKTVSIEWFYSIYEDYAYITIRSIAFQLISLILLVTFVRSENDTNIYALITVISSAGSSILNFIHVRSRFKIHLTKKIKWKEHIKPILVLFAMAATVVIYVSSDITILGVLCGEYTVGIYSVSTKVYTIIKTLLSSALIVSIPRLSAMLGDGDLDRFTAFSHDIYKMIITIVSPVIIGIIILRKEIVIVLSSSEYLTATTSLALLSVALFFCLGSWFWGQCVLVPFKKENVVFKITFISAMLNVVLNFVLIPIMSENAASITTIIAEAFSFIMCRYEASKIIKRQLVFTHLVKVFFGCLFMAVISVMIHSIISSDIFSLGLIVISSISVYLITEIILKNDSVDILMRTIKQIIRK